MSQTRDSDDVPRLEDWITLSRAAEILGISRQAVGKRAKNGHFQTLHAIGDTRIVREAEVREHAARPPRPKGIPNLTARQVEYLLDELHHGCNQSGYSWFITTGRALEARGLITRGSWRAELTDEGRRVAEFYSRQGADA